MSKEMREIHSLLPEQSHAARALLGDMTMQEVAAESGLARSTIERFEKSATKAQLETVGKLRDFYESRGIRFVNDGAEIGVLRCAVPDEPESE